jgi:DNA-binding CsgD family transcriptional regulator
MEALGKESSVFSETIEPRITTTDAITEMQRNLVKERIGCGEAEELVKRLVSCAEAPPEAGGWTSAHGETDAEAVMLDIDVDGMRYLLIRMPVTDRSRVHLSPREQEIVRMVARGQSNKIIADVLNISAWTVCTHLRRIFAKLGVCSRAAMVAKLNETGLAGRW